MPRRPRHSAMRTPEATSPSAPPAEIDAMAADPLSGASWECVPVAPDAFASPGELGALPGEWLPAAVPGTAAAALRDAGRWSWGIDDEEWLDGRDWWFRCRFDAAETGGPWTLRLDGLATVADVWLNGEELLHSENMFVANRVEVDQLEAENELVIRCRALNPLLAGRHPRPRWKSLPVRSQSLRWYRTAFQGRLPDFARWAAPVGPWQPVMLARRDAVPEVVERRARVPLRWISGRCRPRRARARDRIPAGVGEDERRRHAHRGLGHARRRRSPRARERDDRAGRTLVAPHPWRPAALRGEPRARQDLAAARLGRLPDARSRPVRRSLHAARERPADLLPRSLLAGTRPGHVRGSARADPTDARASSGTPG